VTTWSPTPKVEIQFSGSTWTDITKWVDLAGGITPTRGRDNEADDALSPGTVTLTLVNDDGRFSPGLSTSPYYPNVAQDRPLRISMLVGGTYKPRFWGKIQSWSVSWLDDNAVSSITTVVASGLLGSFPQYTLRSAASELVRRAAGVEYHWPLLDTEGPCQPLIGTVTLTDNGGTGYGGGGLLPMDEGTDTHPLLVSSSGKLKLTSGPLALSTAAWNLGLVLLAAPTAAGSILQMVCLYLAGTAFQTGMTLKWNATYGFYLDDGAGGTYGYILPTKWPVMLMISGAATSSLLSAQSADGTYWSTVAQPPAGTLSQLILNPTLSGGAQWPPAHLMVSSNQLPDPQLLLGTRSTTAGAASTLSALAGGPTVAGLPAASALLPALDGRDASDALEALVTGMGARLVDALDGTLTWVPFPPSGAVVTVPAGELDPSATWETSDVGWLSDCTISWADGTSWTATRADGKRQSRSIEGVHSSQAQDRSYASFLVNTASSNPRLAEVAFDLATLTEAQRTTLAALTVGSRIKLTSLPTQMPSTLTLIVEGIDEAITEASWTITLKCSPDVYSRLLVLGDATQGVLGTTNILA